MKFLDKLIKKSTKTASVEVKKEIRKSALDLLPGAIAVVGTIIGLLLFRSSGGNGISNGFLPKPTVTNSKIITNNYFLGGLSEDLIRKIMEDK
ncbi:hypothetical protein [Pseudobutyrivibrio sp.]